MLCNDNNVVDDDDVIYVVSVHIIISLTLGVNEILMTYIYICTDISEYNIISLRFHAQPIIYHTLEF